MELKKKQNKNITLTNHGVLHVQRDGKIQGNEGLLL